MTDPVAVKPGPKRGPTGRPNGRIALGLLLIGTGRAAGFAQFGATREAFLASLAPLLGLLIVGSGTIAWTLGPAVGLAVFLTLLCTILAPAVIAELFCRLWDRRQNWALYANVINCSQWLMLAVLVLLVPPASVLIPLGVSAATANLALTGLFFVYVLWFHWFAARVALNLSRLRAVLVMLAVVFGTGVLERIPGWVAGRGSLDEIAARMMPPASPEPAAK